MPEQAGARRSVSAPYGANKTSSAASAAIAGLIQDAPRQLKNFS
jgi:hypothetical protein